MSSPSPAPPPPPGEAVPPEPHEVTHATKAIDFRGRRTHIVYQDGNGPCALLAICNVLLLKNLTSLNSESERVSQDKLLSLVADRLTDQQAKAMDKDLTEKLTTGLYMNPTYTKIDGFEVTRYRALFSDMKISIYHGWLVDPDTPTASAIGLKSFDDLAPRRFEVMAANEDSVSAPPNLSKGESEQAKTVERSSLFHDIDESVLIVKFLDDTVTQLTDYGLSCLRKEVQEGEICVLFRNDHFNTMIKHLGSLYLLQTDESYSSEIDFIWQRLDEVNNQGPFFTSNFVEIEKNDALEEQLALTTNVENVVGDVDSSSTGKLPIFDSTVVNDLVTSRNWLKLDSYLGKLLEPQHMIPHEVHPGLFMLVRKERLLDLIRDKKFEEAEVFFQSSVESLGGSSQGRYAPYNLMREIEYLSSRVQKKSLPEKRESLAYIATRISCYMHLYFTRQDSEEALDLWQFALKLPVPETGGSSKKHNALMCLACCWECDGSHSIAIMRSHILQITKDCKGCSHVTQDMLDRLRSVDPTKPVPTLEAIRNTCNRKRKSVSISDVSAAAAEASKRAVNSGSASMVSAAAIRAPKKPRATPSSKDLGNQLAENTAKTAELEAKRKRLKDIGQSIRKNAGTIKELVPIHMPPGEHRETFVSLAFNIHDLVIELLTLADEL